MTDKPTNFEDMGREIGALVASKQVAYGDSFGKAGDVMRILYPAGISPEQIDDALCVVRIVDKLFRIATDRDALDESPYRDIAGYALLGAARCEKPVAYRSAASEFKMVADMFCVHYPRSQDQGCPGPHG